MPDSIELTRAVEYLVVPAMTMPDGFHQYKWTNPLNIPVAFKLHSFDKEFCPNGALSVLQAAALLHSFTLPISDASGKVAQHVTAQQANPGATPNGETDSLTSRGSSTDLNYQTLTEEGSNFAAPVTLRLDLMFIDETTPGICCIGYLKDVKVKLNGPFLRGQNRAFNLPSSGEFEFTFVHVPQYGNSFNIAQNTPVQQADVSAQAFADDVRDKLYNTLDITRTSTRDYRGFNQ